MRPSSSGCWPGGSSTAPHARAPFRRRLRRSSSSRRTRLRPSADTLRFHRRARHSSIRPETPGVSPVCATISTIRFPRRLPGLRERPARSSRRMASGWGSCRGAGAEEGPPARRKRRRHRSVSRRAWPERRGATTTRFCWRRCRTERWSRSRQSGGVPKPLVIGTQTFTKGFFFPHFLPGGNAVVFNTELAGGLIGGAEPAERADETFGRGLRPNLHRQRVPDLRRHPRRPSRYSKVRCRSPRDDGIAEHAAGGPGRRRGPCVVWVSRSGSTLAITRRAGTELDLALYDRAGREQILFRSSNYWAPRFSPDGNRIALGGGIPGDVWIYDIPTKSRHRFTREGLDGNDPVWSPDGEQIVFASMRPTPKDLHVRQTNGSRPDRQLLVRDGLQWPSDWTRDGYIVFTDVLVGGDRDIWVVKADGSQPPLPYLDTDFIEKGGVVSPDGRWLAYDSNASGQVDVVVNSFPKAFASPVIVSEGGGRNPRWGHDGRELFYWKERKLIAVGSIGRTVRESPRTRRCWRRTTPPPIMRISTCTRMGLASSS